MSRPEPVRPASPTPCVGLAELPVDPSQTASRYPMRPSHLVDWNEAAERYADLVYSVPLKRGLSRHDADEVFQNSWLAVLSKAEVPEEDGMVPWLAAIAWRQTMALLQRRRDTAPFDELVESFPDRDEPEPRRILEQAEEEQAVRKALSMLPPRDRLLIQELFLNDVPRNHAEIAAQLGLETGSVGTLRRRALDRLEETLVAIAAA
jgi:RNA polymerase sigma factor (sigma-70 family)